MKDLTIDEAKEFVKKVCPEMLTNENFMKHTINKYCSGEFVNIKALSDEEYEAWKKLREVIGIATVGQLVSYLKETFKPEDKLCYMDCVEGLKNDCTYITKDQLNKQFFYYVSDLKKYNIEKRNMSKEEVDQMFPYVNDNDVVMI